MRALAIASAIVNAAIVVYDLPGGDGNGAVARRFAELLGAHAHGGRSGGSGMRHLAFISMTYSFFGMLVRARDERCGCPLRLCVASRPAPTRALLRTYSNAPRHTPTHNYSAIACDRRVVRVFVFSCSRVCAYVTNLRRHRSAAGGGRSDRVGGVRERPNPAAAPGRSPDRAQILSSRTPNATGDTKAIIKEMAPGRSRATSERAEGAY